MAIPPTEQPDSFWFEKRVGQIVEDVTGRLLAARSYLPAAGILEPWNSWLAEETARLDVRGTALGLQFIDRLIRRLEEDNLFGAPTPVSVSHLAVVDALLRALPGGIGSFNQRLSTTSIATLMATAVEAARGKPCRQVFSPRVHDVLTHFKSAYRFERDVEGRRTTPEWFLQHHIARQLTADLLATIQDLLERAEAMLQPQVALLGRILGPEAVVVGVNRGMEAVFKLEGSLSRLPAAIRELESFRNPSAGDEWPNSDWKGWSARTDAIRRSLYVELVGHVDALPDERPGDDSPDSFGFAYTMLSHAAIDALIKADSDLFSRIYPALVTLSLRAHDRVRKDLAGHPVDTALHISADVLLDVLEVSGYAYLSTYALGRTDWRMVERTWDAVLTAHPDPRRLLELIVLEVDYYKSQFSMTPRSITRTEWRMRMQRLLQESGFQAGHLFGEQRPRSLPISHVVAAYVRSMDIGHDAFDLMLSEYLLARPEGSGLSIPRGVKQLRDSANLISNNRANGRLEGVDRFGRVGQ